MRDSRLQAAFNLGSPGRLATGVVLRDGDASVQFANSAAEHVFRAGRDVTAPRMNTGAALVLTLVARLVDHESRFQSAIARALAPLAVSAVRCCGRAEPRVRPKLASLPPRPQAIADHFFLRRATRHLASAMAHKPATTCMTVKDSPAGESSGGQLAEVPAGSWPAGDVPLTPSGVSSSLLPLPLRLAASQFTAPVAPAFDGACVNASANANATPVTHERARSVFLREGVVLGIWSRKRPFEAEAPLSDHRHALQTRAMTRHALLDQAAAALNGRLLAAGSHHPRG